MLHRAFKLQGKALLITMERKLLARCLDTQAQKHTWSYHCRRNRRQLL